MTARRCWGVWGHLSSDEFVVSELCSSRFSVLVQHVFTRVCLPCHAAIAGLTRSKGLEVPGAFVPASDGTSSLLAIPH